MNHVGLVLAEWTGLEPATPGVTGRYSNRLNYHSLVGCHIELRSMQQFRHLITPDVMASPRGFEPLYSP